MNSEQLIQQINSSQSIGKNEIAELEKLLLEHPYFQSGQLLLTKGLLNTNSIRYNQQLKKAAAYSSDRKKLFELIILKSADKPVIKSVLNQEPIKEEKLDIGKPLAFDENESHSFSFNYFRYINYSYLDRVDWTIPIARLVPRNKYRWFPHSHS